MHCLCNHLTSFGGGFVVAPNPIDFDKVFEGFKNLSDNISVFATIITAFAIYILMAVWLRRKDKKDETMVSRTEISPHLLRGFFGLRKYTYLFAGSSFERFPLLVFSNCQFESDTCHLP